MKNKDGQEVMAMGVSVESVTHADGSLTIGFIVFSPDQGTRIAWLPDLFKAPLADLLRADITAALRFHADKMANGETERKMHDFSEINTDLHRRAAEA